MVEEKHPKLQVIRGDGRVEVVGELEEACAASDWLYKSMRPVKLRFDKLRNTYHYYMCRELINSGQLHHFGGIAIEHKETQRTIEFTIYGTGLKQGELMRMIGSFSDEFESRFFCQRLSESDFHRLEMRGRQVIDNLNGMFRCRIDVDTDHKLLLFQGADSRSLQECRTEFERQTVDLIHPVNVCCACHREVGDVQLSICGHWYCRGCFEGHANGGQPRKVCHCCDEAIAVADFRSGMEDKWQGVVDQVITRYVRRNPELNYGFCPNGCNGLIKADGCYFCVRCSREVCVHCRAVGDSRHLGVSCAEYLRRIREGDWKVASFRKAAKWASDNWSAGLGRINAIEVNPCLTHNCLAVKRFLAAAGASGSSDPLMGLNTFWAWHGSGEDGILAICCQGWKPSLRAGQGHGPGEYFGCTAAVSAGYSPGNHMIVALIIMDQCVSTVGGFCYVVNNPMTDTGPCFCLPVAVVSFRDSAMIGRWPHPLSREDAAEENYQPHQPEGNRPAQVFPQGHVQAPASAQWPMGYPFWG
jgi:hypothetical protein